VSLDFNIETTVLFHKVKEKLFQVAKLKLNDNTGSEPIKLTLKTHGWKKEYDMAYDKNEPNLFDIDIPPIEKDTKCRATLEIKDKKLEKDIILKTHRKWEVHIQNFTHTDIGYTDLPSRVAKSYVKAMKSIIRFCDETRDFDDDSKYRWNVETGYWLENAISGLTEDELKKVKKLVREGRIEITPLYVAHTSEFNDEETLVRSMYFGFEFAKKCGVKVKTAMASDSTGQPWLFPQMLSKSGICYLSTAVNIGMAKAPKLPRPFYWRSLDGSKILVLDTDERQAYQEGVMVGLAENYDKVIKKLPAYLTDLETDGKYGFDLIAFRNPGFAGDNTQPNVNVSHIVEEWNSKWEYPKLIISTYTPFFEKFEEKYGSRVKEFSGAWPDWWANYNGASAFETAVNRHTHTDMVEGERLSSLLKIKSSKAYYYPENELKEIYKKILLADEADWSSYSSVTEPDGLQARGQKFEEASFVYQAAINAREIAENSRSNISKLASPNTKSGIVVTNSLSWTRSGIVNVSIPLKLFDGKKNMQIVDSETGKKMPSQFTEPDVQTNDLKMVFKAEDIPPFGFKTYDLIPTDREDNKDLCATGSGEIENEFYKVKYNPESGGISSILDKELKEELIDSKNSYSFNQLIYESPEKPRFVSLKDHMGLPEDVLFLQPYYISLHDYYFYPVKGEKLNRWSPEDQKILSVKRGEIYTEIITKSSTHMCPEVISHFLLNNHFKEILVKNYLVKTETLEAEAVYYTFPFNVANPKMRLNCHGGYFEPEAEQLPGSSKDWYCVQKWIDVGNDRVDILWSPIEAPLVQLCQINTGKWLDNITIDNGTIFSYAMNNYWWTNSPASQGGRFWFNYAITSKKPGFDSVYANRFGYSTHIPLSAAVIEDKDSLAKYKTYSPIGEIPENIMVIGLKKAEVGEGFVVRLIEVSGKKCSFKLKFTDKNIKKAFLASPVEEDVKSLNIVDGSISVLINPFELVTLRIVF